MQILGQFSIILKKKWRKLYKTSQKTIQCNVVTLTFQKNTNNNVFYLNNSSCESLAGNQKSIYYYYYLLFLMLQHCFQDQGVARGRRINNESSLISK